MARLPEPGDAESAFDALDDRARALADGDLDVEIGEVTIDANSWTVSGPGMDRFRLAYGDLFDVQETLSRGGLSLVGSTATRWLLTQDSLSALTSMLLMSVAVGVLMERARWESREARSDG